MHIAYFLLSLRSETIIKIYEKNYPFGTTGYGNNSDSMAQEFDFKEVEYTPKETTFTLFAPSTYASVGVEVYSHGKKTELEIPRYKALKRVGENLWQCKIKGDLKGKYYAFYVSDKLKTGLYTYLTLGMAKYTNHFGPTPGVFAKAVGVNGMRGAIVDMKDSNPMGWENDQRPVVKSPADLVIYEMHHRDFSIDASSGLNIRESSLP